MTNPITTWPVTLPGVLPKLVESFALDAIENEVATNVDDVTEGTGSFLEETSRAELERFPAVGEGEDFRLQGGSLAGGALVKSGRVIHLCVFRVSNGHGAEQKRRGRMVRASLRRRGRASE